MRQDQRSPLTGVRVVDLSTTFMGPYCTALLAQWGADVIKVEAPAGDVLRYIGDVKGVGLGPVYLNANRGKRSMVLDLKRAGADEVLDRLVRGTDILVHNMRPRAAQRLGITADRLLGLNEKLIFCAFRGFGAGGPYEDRPAYDDVIQAASGMAAVQGGPGGTPNYIRMSAADKTMGLVGAASILAALHGRHLTGAGRAIEVPMFESMTAFVLLEQQGGMVFDPPLGPPGYPRTESPHRRPCRTKDGYLAVMVYTDAQWAAFFDAIGRPELAGDPKFGSIRERTIHVDELYALMNEHLEQRSTEDWQRIFRDAHIASGPVNTIPDLFEDPHLVATQFFETSDHPHAGRLRLARPPVDMGDADTRSIRHAPQLGEHTTDVLSELGYDGAEVSRMLEAGVVAASHSTMAEGSAL